MRNWLCVFETVANRTRLFVCLGVSIPIHQDLDKPQRTYGQRWLIGCHHQWQTFKNQQLLISLIVEYNYHTINLNITTNKTYLGLLGSYRRGGRGCSAAVEASWRGGPCGVTGSGVLDGRREPRDVTGEGVTSSLINSLLKKWSSKSGVS